MRQNSVRTASRIFDDNNETIKQNSDHIYKRRLTESEIITYIADHIVYKTSKKIIEFVKNYL